MGEEKRYARLRVLYPEVETAIGTYEQVCATYRDVVDVYGSLTKSSKRLLRDDAYLSGQLGELPGLRLLDLLSSLVVLGHPAPAEVLYRALFDLDTCPATILAAARERQNLPRDPFLAELAPRLLALAAAGPTERDPRWPSRAQKIRELDRLRRRDRELAKRRVQKLIATNLDLLEKGARPPEALAQLCGAICVLAVIYRLAGRRDDATDLLVLTYPLVEQTGNPAVKAEWLRKAAYLLVDLANNKRADEFIVEAHELFDLADLPAERLRTLVDRAYVYYHAKKHALSVDYLQKALLRLDESDSEYRAAAHQILALNFRASGKLAAAREQLDAAILLAKDDIRGRAYCLLARAEILIECKNVPAGLASYLEAMPLCAKHMGAAELAELAMKYATILFHERRRPELLVLAADLSGWLEELQAHLKLRDAIADFQALVEMDSLDHESLRAILGRIAEAGPQEKRGYARTNPIGA